MLREEPNNGLNNLQTPKNRRGDKHQLHLSESAEEEPEVFCFICGLEYEDHALDFNIGLLFYNSLLQDCFLNQHLQKLGQTKSLKSSEGTFSALEQVFRKDGGARLQQDNQETVKMPEILADLNHQQNRREQRNAHDLILAKSNLSSSQVSYREPFT